MKPEDGESTSRWSGAAGFRATGISRSFEGVQALDEVDLEIHRKEVVGLIGPNGAGKTTLVNLMTGFDFPDRGEIVLDGETITEWNTVKRAAAGLARTFQHGHLFGELSVRENIEVAALGVGAGVAVARERADALLDVLGLADRAERPASELPQGEGSKLGVARALASEPRYVLLDEPGAGLAEPEVPAFVEVIRSVRDEHGAGVLLIDHNIALIMAVCDRVVVLDQGRILLAGTPEEVRGSAEVAAAYLGGQRNGAEADA